MILIGYNICPSKKKDLSIYLSIYLSIIIIIIIIIISDRIEGER